MKRHFAKVIGTIVALSMIFSLVPCGQAWADGASPLHYEDILILFEEMDAIISEDVANGFPSAQLAIMHHGNLIYSKAWGSAKLYNSYGVPLSERDRIPATTQTLYDIGGTTEIFTAWYVALKLISEGKLDFRTKIVDVLGEDFVESTIGQKWIGMEAETMDIELIKNWKRVLTVADLLKNTSGFPAGPNFHKQFITTANGELMRNAFYNASGSREESLQLIKMMPLEVEPGTRVAPSDVDAVLLTFVVEAIIGERIDEYLARFWQELDPTLRITYNPLANGYTMQECAATEVSGNTRFGMVDFYGARTDVLQGTVHDETAYYGMEGVSGNAGLFANAESLAKLLTTFINPESGIFSDEVKAKMFEKMDGANTSMAWYIWSDEQGYVKELWLNSFTRCYVGVLPAADTVVVYLTNTIHSPIAFTSEKFTEHDLAHAKFSGSMYSASNSAVLYRQE